MDEYLVPTKEAHVEWVEKRSRFIGHIFCTDTEDEATAKIRSMREKYYDATHNVYAYILHGGTMRYSDDSEPQGTAGMPVLEVLRRENIENVLCVVTRYFGGILLGAGGLVRAYAKSAKQALDEAGTSCMRVWEEIDLPCPYNLYERMKKLLETMGGQTLDTRYGSEILIKCLLPQTKTDEFLEKVVDISCGKLQGEVISQQYRAFPIEK